MTRERLAWLISVLLLAILAFQLPGSFAQRDNEYSWVRTIVQIHQQVDDNYVEPVNDSELKIKAINGMLGDLDPYTQYIPPEKQENFEKVIGGTFKGVGISLLQRETDKKIVVITPIEGGPADKAGVHSGDIILKVDGKSVDGLKIDDVSKMIVGPIGTPVTLTMQRGEFQVDFTMQRQQIYMPTVLGYERNTDDTWKFFVSDHPKIGYLRITQFDENTYQEVKSAFTGSNGMVARGMQGLLLDLRFNGGGRLDQAVAIVNMFVKKGETIVTTKGRNRPEDIKRGDGTDMLPNFPVIVLVNDDTASASEIVSGSLKDNHRAEIIGQRTFGKGSVQEVIDLGGDSGELKMTVAYYYLPSGRLVHRKQGATDWGVNPDIIVPMDENQEAGLEEAMEMRNTIRHTPGVAATEIAAASTRPTTQPLDPQFDTALRTMIGLIVLENNSTRPSPQ